MDYEITVLQVTVLLDDVFLLMEQEHVLPIKQVFEVVIIYVVMEPNDDLVILELVVVMFTGDMPNSRHVKAMFDYQTPTLEQVMHAVYEVINYRKNYTVFVLMTDLKQDFRHLKIKDY